MAQQYRDRAERQVTDARSDSTAGEERSPTESETYREHDLATTPGKFTDGAGQGTSGEGAITAHPRTDEGDDDVPSAVARPSDPPSHEKGARTDG
jgi:hypothetical protein